MAMARCVLCARMAFPGHGEHQEKRADAPTGCAARIDVVRILARSFGERLGTTVSDHAISPHRITIHYESKKISKTAEGQTLRVDSPFA